jgi:hypothetical protein
MRRQTGGTFASVRRFTRFAVCALTTLLPPCGSAFSPQSGVGPERQSTEYRVKAAFLLNFTKFAAWPVSAAMPADSPLSICILGDDPFGPVLDQKLDGETLNGRKLVARRVHPEEANSCSVLFVPGAGKTVRPVLAGLRPGVLTVGEGQEFLREGGMIAFITDDGHVRFNVNLKAARKGGIEISSKLLNVARTVEH